VIVLFLRGRFTGNPVTFIGPLPEVEQATAFRAKRAIGVARVGSLLSALGASNCFY